MKALWAILRKDIQQEARSAAILPTVLAFTATSLLLILYTLRAQNLDPTPQSGLLWIVLLFASLTASQRVFLHERDQQTLPILLLHGHPLSIYGGKFLFNMTVLASLITLFSLLYVLLINSSIAHWGAFVILIVAGSIGLAGVTTITSAMMAQTDKRGALFSVISIPLLVPLIMILSRVTTTVFSTGTLDSSWNDVAALVGFCGVNITLGIMFFESLFKEASAQ